MSHARAGGRVLAQEQEQQQQEEQQQEQQEEQQQWHIVADRGRRSIVADAAEGSATCSITLSLLLRGTW